MGLLCVGQAQAATKGEIMAIKKKWTEVDNECFGPNKENNKWQMLLVVVHCATYSRRTKTGPKEYTRRKKTVIPFFGKLKKDVRAQLEKYMARKDVFLMPSKPPRKG